MELNRRTIKLIIELKIKFIQRLVTIHFFGLTERHDSFNVTKIRVPAIMRHDKRTDMQNN